MKILTKIKKIPIFFHDIREFNPKEFAYHDYEIVFKSFKKDIIKLINCPLEKSSVLILGCGYNYPEVIFFSRIAKDVIGLDVRGPFYKDGIIKTFKDIWKKENSLVKVLIETFLKKYHYKKYYLFLTNVSGIEIKHKKYKVITYDGNRIPFEDETFNIVLSNAVLEHIKDIEKVSQEINRVTKKGGISYHVWHNYYSFSGGHKSEYLSLKYPWGHLREKYETSGLNKLTPSKIKYYFSKYFEIIGFYGMDKKYRKKEIDEDFQYEKKDLLKGRIKKELLNFPEELLLTRGYLIIGKKH